MSYLKKSEHLLKRLADAVRNAPAAVVASAATAAGTALVTLGLPVAINGVVAATRGETLVAIFSEPVDRSSAAANNSCGAGSVSAMPAVLGQLRQADPRPHEKQVEFWTRSSSGRTIVATVKDEAGVGHGEITGFEKTRNTLVNFDTISASFDGAVIGRGTYSLERHYTNGTADPWWRGRHTFYDCHRNITLTCPIVVGPPVLRKQMEGDPWLDASCWIENSPAKTTSQRTAAN